MSKLTRRTVIATAAVVPVAAIRSAAQPSAEMALLEAVADRIIPPDENGPGAREAGAAAYIDGALGADRSAFFEILASIDRLSREKTGRAFIELPPAAQDEVLTAFESGSRAAFNRVRQLTMEACSAIHPTAAIAALPDGT